MFGFIIYLYMYSVDMQVSLPGDGIGGLGYAPEEEGSISYETRTVRVLVVVRLFGLA